MRIIKIVLFVALFFLSSQIFPQSINSDYEVTISNYDEITNNLWEFDINIRSTNNDFILTSYQFALKFGTSVPNSDSVYFEYLPNTSDLVNEPEYVIGTKKNDGNIEVTLASFAEEDNISSNYRRVGKFRVHLISSSSTPSLDLYWNFEGNVQTILTGNNFANITDPSNHVSLITDVTNEDPLENIKYKLFQNYPNPFNPTTTVKFNLARDNKVILTVYNALGELVKEVFASQLKAGSHQLKIDASNWASGIYFYRIDMGSDFSEVKRMILLK